MTEASARARTSDDALGVGRLAAGASRSWFRQRPWVVDLVVVLAVFTYNLPIQVSWITPACAGNTHAGGLVDDRQRDHPRVRGEHTSPAVGSKGDAGSPPRARGTPTRVMPDLAEVGITPACAGNTRCQSQLHPRVGDHPRVRGEHSTPRGCARPLAGSPPRARGTRRVRRGCPGGSGITPACAGNTSWRCGGRRCRWDHPRVRGEHRGEHDADTGVWLRARGSPPRARGTPGRVRRRVPGRGITPACAGNTGSATRVLGRFRDHPRVRGEHTRS